MRFVVGCTDCGLADFHCLVVAAWDSLLKRPEGTGTHRTKASGQQNFTESQRAL